MIEHADVAGRFEAERPRLRSVAYRMLGSLSEADDAVQEAWIRLGRAGAAEVRNLGSWLTTVVSRVCLDQLRSRASRREEALDDHLLGVERTVPFDPEQEAVLADSVGLAMLVVLERLPAVERIAFVLHDMFELPFDEIARIVNRSPAATRQLASRGRRRVHGAPAAATDRALQLQAVEAFLAASRAGDLDALLAVLDPEVVRHQDNVRAAGEAVTRGAREVAPGLLKAGAAARFARIALVDGQVGLVVAPRGRLVTAIRLSYVDGRIAAIDVITRPDRLKALGLGVLGG
jgi:RNA polymerase sigma-70 factor (ECF subfamily)